MKFLILLLMPILLLSGGALAACDTDLFASSTCVRPSLRAVVDVEPIQEASSASSGVGAGVSDVAVSPPTVNTVSGERHQNIAVGGYRGED